MGYTITPEIDSDSIWLEPCENGFILNWTTRTASPGSSGGPYDMCYKYCYEKEVFKASEGSKAIARMNEVFVMSGEEMNDKD